MNMNNPPHVTLLMKLSLCECSVNDYIDYRNALIGRRKINTLMYFGIDTCTLLRKLERVTEYQVSYRCLGICVNGGFLNYSNFVCMQFLWMLSRCVYY
jgi:hypothetical protein